MTTNASLQDSSTPNPPTGRSLFSRLALPLRSRARNLVDFHIQPHEPHRQYSPGDLVKGLVVLTIGKPIRITHLTVALNGYIRVYKSPNGVTDGSADAVSLPAGNTRKTQYLGQGHASLFQDEQILCGEGRLETGIYEFEFELEFPKKGLPTSIDFERGTISYVIRSTITRPTSIAAASSCDRKISLVESVDIGLLVPPKPRVITLEPISRRSRKSVRASARLERDTFEGQSTLDVSHRAESPAPEESASQSGSSEQMNAQRIISNGDAQSEVSAESVLSSTTGRSIRLGSGQASSRSLKISQTPADQPCNETVTDKTIIATIELLKAGCLPGDSVPLRVSIQHTKAIRSMHGIIITLYRQGRIDYAPPLTPFVDVTGKAAQKLKHEEYYPKSKTGLGGLSLSSAGSSSVFRKDLAQTFAPLIINPATLSTIVTASIRVPEDVFPTITGVPAQMIDFKYHVEVVVDLGGKLAGQDRHIPRTGIMKSTYANSNNLSPAREDGSGNFLTAWGGSVVDTDHIRREKSVVSCAFELIVGTTDSARMRGRGNAVPQIRTPESTTPKPLSLASDIGERESYEDPGIGEYHDEQRYNRESQHRVYRSPNMERNETYESHMLPPEHRFIAQFERPLVAPVPPPESIAEIYLPEKERARRAEQRLLPSQPPGAEVGPSSSILPPSAPAYLEVDAHTYQNGLSAPLDDSACPSTVPTAPLHDELEPHTSKNPEVDKQELERQRLMAEVSSPPTLPNEDHPSEPLGGEMQFTPTAPFLGEEENFGGHHYIPTEFESHEEHEDLPGYQR